MPPVSVPEKTLEHWVSQYITYRTRSKCALWWPARGEDVNVRALPARPGKVVQLEIKTTVPSGAHQDVKIDLVQLRNYCRRTPGNQPFYVFPWPDWTGKLEDHAKAMHRSVTDLAYARSGLGWWFADWMRVMTTTQVATVLRAQLGAHGESWRRRKETLVRFDPSSGWAGAEWADGRAGDRSIGWLRFWSELEECGRPDWPQLAMLPQGKLHLRGRPTHAGMKSALSNFSRISLDAAAEYQYELVDVTAGAEFAAIALEDQLGTGTEEHRQIVFLPVDALRLQ